VILSATDESGRVRLVRNVASLGLTVDGREWNLSEPVRFDLPADADALPACLAVVEVDGPAPEGR
jgi:hypothetical protein